MKIRRGDEGDAPRCAEERGEGRAAPGTEGSPGVKKDAAGAHASRRRNWAIERTM